MSKAYEVINDRIIALLNEGVAPWQKPWKVENGLPRNLFTNRPYNGINIWMLNCQGYDSPFWATYNQIAKAGGHVLPGSKATPIVFWQVSVKQDAETGKQKKLFFLTYYNVFNAEQTVGVALPVIDRETPLFTPIEHCAKLVSNMPKAPEIFHGGERAFYRPSKDEVHMPAPQTFSNPEAYYSTLFHELTHSTGHESRLDRPTLKDAVMFGDIKYAEEELIAEMGAAYLCGITGIANTTINNSASYLKGWLATFQGNQKMLIQAASKAQKAAEYMQGIINNKEDAE